MRARPETPGSLGLLLPMGAETTPDEGYRPWDPPEHSASITCRRRCRHRFLHRDSCPRGAGVWGK